MAMLGMASGHIIMQAVGVNGKDYEQGYGIYMPSDNSFISDVTSDSLACNGSPVSGFQSSTEVIPVKAGDTVTGNWLHTLTSTGPDGSADNKVIDSSHKGPVMAYMKKVSDATQNPSAGPGDGWFKIAEAGLISSSQWAVDALIEAGGVQTVTIPSCIEDGDYLLRFELIALHDGTKPNGAQFYVCDTPVLINCRPMLTHGSTDGVRPDLGLWRHRWKHTGDCFDPRSLLCKSTFSLLIDLSADTQNRRPTPASRSTFTTTTVNRTPRPTTSSQVSHKHPQFCRWHTSSILTSLSKVPNSSHVVLALLPSSLLHPQAAAPSLVQAAPSLLSSRSSRQLAPPSLRSQQPLATIRNLLLHRRRPLSLLLVRRLSARSSTFMCRSALEFLGSQLRPDGKGSTQLRVSW